ncbi:MAG: hypothetical protein ACQEUB_12590 [Thermodesulfobacteriota bacterium]
MFVTMEYDVNTGGYELCLLFDTDYGLMPTPIHLIPGKGLKSGLEKAQEVALRNSNQKVPVRQNEIDRLLAKTKDFISIQLIQDAVNLTLYLCFEAPDL